MVRWPHALPLTLTQFLLLVSVLLLFMLHLLTVSEVNKLSAEWTQFSLQWKHCSTWNANGSGDEGCGTWFSLELLALFRSTLIPYISKTCWIFCSSEHLLKSKYVFCFATTKTQSSVLHMSCAKWIIFTLSNKVSFLVINSVYFFQKITSAHMTSCNGYAWGIESHPHGFA